MLPFQLDSHPEINPGSQVCRRSLKRRVIACLGGMGRLFLGFGFCASLHAQFTYTAYHFTTLAGRAGSFGAVDGIGNAARFNAPANVAVDSGGNVYVADLNNHAIRKITAGGVVTTFAGALGVSGSVDGIGNAARFNYPSGVAVDKSDNVYVSEWGNQTIRKITLAGQVTTLAGAAGTFGEADGTGSTARFTTPASIAVAPDGTLYVADAMANTIRKITPGGVVTTLAGLAGNSGSANGTGAAARFNFPSSVAVGSDGVIYVADQENDTVRQITSAGVVTTLAGTVGSSHTSGSADGIGLAARFSEPTGVAVDDNNNVYVADQLSSRIRRISPGGIVTTLAGGSSAGADGTGAAAGFFQPPGVAVDSHGNVYVADYSDYTVRVGSPNRAPVASSGTANAPVGQAASFTLPVTDADGDPLTFTLVSNTNGTATLSGGNRVTFVPFSVSAGPFSVSFSASDGYLSSNVATVVVTVGSPPVITRQPSPQSANDGGMVTFSVSITSDTAVNYQWWFNGVPIPGATAATLALNSVSATEAGDYSVVIVNSGGSVTSETAALNVVDSRLYALSCRALVGAGSDVLIPGFIIGGLGQRDVILRVSGPAIQGVSGTLAQPKLELHQVGVSAPVATNLGWSSGTSADTAALQVAFTRAGLPQYPVGSADCAVLVTLNAGSAYTAVVSGVNNTSGVALVELYEAGSGTARMTALSCRARVGTGENILIPGIIVIGSAPKQVLIRAAGPSIQGVAGTLAQPRLELYDGSGHKLAENVGWSTAANAAAIFTATPACGLANFPAGSADCAILVTLPPGGYTAQVSGAGGTTGVALIEVYEVP